MITRGEKDAFVVGVFVGAMVVCALLLFISWVVK